MRIGEADRYGYGYGRDAEGGHYLTAYGLALRAGFRGTLEEWLASLHGPAGADGEPGDDYVLTEADREEIAERAAEVGETVRYVEQTLTPEQQERARANIGAGSALPVYTLDWLIEHYPQSVKVTDMVFGGRPCKRVGFYISQDDSHNPPDGQYMLCGKGDFTGPDYLIMDVNIITWDGQDKSGAVLRRSIFGAATLCLSRNGMVNNAKLKLAGALSGENFIDFFEYWTDATGWVYTKHDYIGGQWVRENVLTKTNTLEYTPTGDYHPATKKYVDEAVGDKITAPATAAAGQTIKVSAVDDDGKPVAWEAADLPSAGSGGIPVPAAAAVGDVLRVKAVDADGRPTEWECAAVGGEKNDKEWSHIGSVVVTGQPEYIPLSNSGGVVVLDPSCENYAQLINGSNLIIISPIDEAKYDGCIVAKLVATDYVNGEFALKNRDNVAITKAYDPAIFKITLQTVVTIGFNNVPEFDCYAQEASFPCLATHGIRNISYCNMTSLNMDAAVVIENSGGVRVRKETTLLADDTVISSYEITAGNYYGNGATHVKGCRVYKNTAGQGKLPTNNTIMYDGFSFPNRSRIELYGRNVR